VKARERALGFQLYKRYEVDLNRSSFFRKVVSEGNLAQHISTALELAYENAERRKTEEALRESMERLKQLIVYAPDAILMNDLQGNFIGGNRQAEDPTGYRKDELT